MSKILQIGVKVILLNSAKDKFLGIKRNKNKILQEKEDIDIPGGRIEIGEEPLEGLTRELIEEIGYSLKSDLVLLDASNIVNNEKLQIVRLTYIAENEGIEIKNITLGNEHEGSVLVDFSENKNNHPLLNKSIAKYKSIFGKEA